jgi:hypothetical protein
VKSGGGEETKEQKWVRQIEQTINEKAGVLVSEEAIQSTETMGPRKGSHNTIISFWISAILFPIAMRYSCDGRVRV